MAQILNTITRLGVAIALVGGAANSMLYNGNFKNFAKIFQNLKLNLFNFQLMEVTELLFSIVFKVLKKTLLAKVHIS